MIGETSRISLADTELKAPTEGELDELKARRVAVVDVWVTAKYQQELQNFDAQISQAMVGTQQERVQSHSFARERFVREKKEELEQKFQDINAWIQREMSSVAPRLSNTDKVAPWNAGEKVLKSTYSPIKIDLEDLKFLADIMGKEVEVLAQRIPPTASEIATAKSLGQEAKAEEEEYTVVELGHNAQEQYKVYLTDARYADETHGEPAMFAVYDRHLAEGEKRNTFAGRPLYPNRPQAA